MKLPAGKVILGTQDARGVSGHSRAVTFHGCKEAAGVGKAKAQSAHSSISKGWQTTERRLDKVKHLEEERQALEVPAVRQNLHV